MAGCSRFEQTTQPSFYMQKRSWSGKSRLSIAVLVDVDGTLAGVYRNGRRPIRPTAEVALRLRSSYAPVFLGSIAGEENGRRSLRSTPRTARTFQAFSGKGSFRSTRWAGPTRSMMKTATRFWNGVTFLCSSTAQSRLKHHRAKPTRHLLTAATEDVLLSSLKIGVQAPKGRAAVIERWNGIIGG